MRIRQWAVKNWRPYGTSTIGACQNAAFCPAGSSTVTWQSYLPVGRVANERLNLSGRALDLGSYPFGHREWCCFERLHAIAIESSRRPRAAEWLSASRW